MLGGTTGNPPDSAVFMFDCADPSVIEAFVQADPYVQNGLVLRHTIVPWTTVVGDAAHTPVRPE